MVPVRIERFRPILTKVIRFFAPLLFWGAVWVAAYRAVGKDLLFASPAQVLRQLAEIVVRPDAWRAIGLSILRMLSAFTLGVAGGCLLAALTSASRWADALLRPALTAIRSTPVASFIILALVWLRGAAVPVFAATLMALPIVWANVTQGVAATDRDLLEMARVFRFGRWRTVRHVVIPGLRGTLVAACNASIGLCWKAMIAAEVLSAPRDAMGTQLYNAKVYLRTDALFAWTLLIILLSYALERLFLRLTRRLTREAGRA
ncbi:MAG: ABC transporter permease subunit [Oscillospiraceae bacterium]|jgi:NitT/TauT family transport system permease protein|nr:ABC transporter permease subunit [Oscillospiraceae bacterium]